MLTAIHVLLTYKCTGECDHCFLHCGPRCQGIFTLSQLRELLSEIEKIGTIDTVYFEGGEPFLFYAVLLNGLRMVRAAGVASRDRDQRLLGDLGGRCCALAAPYSRFGNRRLQRER